MMKTIPGPPPPLQGPLGLRALLDPWAARPMLSRRRIAWQAPVLFVLWAAGAAWTTIYFIVEELQGRYLEGDALEVLGRFLSLLMLTAGWVGLGVVVNYYSGWQRAESRGKGGGRAATWGRVAVPGYVFLLILFTAQWLALGNLREGSFHDEIVIPFFAWVGGEVLAVGLGITLTMMEYVRWRQGGRLPELALTPLRPLDIGQLLLNRPLRKGLLLICALLAGIAGGVGLASTRLLLMLAVPLLLTALNCAMTFAMTAWAALTLCLALGSWMLAARQCLAFVMVVTLCGAPLALGSIMLIVILDRLTHGQNEILLLICFVFPFLIGLFPLKWLYLRAWAGRLERAVWPSMEF